jgi:hypothetical protein
VDYNLEIRKLSTELQEKINSWIRQESAYEVEDLRGEGESLLETMYLLSCPQLHIVPEHELRTRIDTDKHVSFLRYLRGIWGSWPSLMSAYGSASLSTQKCAQEPS